MTASVHDLEQRPAAPASPFERLLALADGLTLSVFVLVDLALWRIQRRGSGPPGRFHVPRWMPPLAALTGLALIVAVLAA